MKTSIFLVLIFLTAGLAGSFAQKYERAIEISERYYEEGQYVKALENIDRKIEQIKKTDRGFLLTEMVMYRIKYLEALGEYGEFEANINSVLEAKKRAGEQSLVYGKALLDIAFLYAEYSDIKTAQYYLEQAEEILALDHSSVRKSEEVTSEESVEDLYFKSTRLITKSEIHYKRGEFDQAREFVDELIGVREKRITDRELYFEVETNSYKIRSLDRFQQDRRLDEYAEALTLRGVIERERGDYATADSLLAEAENWILNNIKKKELAYINNKYQRILVDLEFGKDISNAKRELEKLIFLAERKLGLVHKTYLAIHETLIEYYITSRYFRKSRLQRWELDVNTSRYYGTESTPHAIWVRMEAKKDYFDKNYADAYDGLIELYNHLTKVPDNHIERIKVVDQLYRAALANDLYNEARDFIYEKRKLQNKILGENSLSFHKASMELADYYITFTNKFDSAKVLLANSFDGVIDKRLAPTHKDFPSYLMEYAEFHETMGDFELARPLINRMVSITKEKYGEGHIRYAIALEPLADIDIEASAFKDANVSVEKMLTIFDSLGYKRRVYDLEYSHVVETAARYYAIMGLFDRANDLISKANRLNSRSAEAIANSSAIDELAYLYIRTERYKQTEDLLNEAIEVRKERYGEESRFLITPYNQLGLLSYIQGDLVKAEELVNKALKIANETFGENALQTAESHTIKADIYSAIGDYEKAKDEANFVIELEKSQLGAEHVELANSYTQLALIKFFAKENISEVENLMVQAKDNIALNLGDDTPVYAGQLKNLALVYSQSGKLNEAYVLLTRANQIWVERLGSEMNSNSAAIEILQGDIEIQRGNNEEAILHYEEARKIYSKIFNKNHPEYVKSTAKLGRAYYVMQEYRKSQKYTEEALENYLQYIDKFFPALSEREKTRYWAKIRNDFEFYISLAVTYKNKSGLLAKVYENTLATKALLLSSSIKIRNRILNSGDSTLISTFNQWQSKKEQLTKVLAMSSEQQKEENVDPKKMEKEIEQLEKDLSNQSNVFASGQSEKVKWKDIKDALKPNEAAVEIIRYRHFDKAFTDSVLYAALIITPKTNREPELVILPNGNNLESKELGYYRSCIQFEIQDERSYANFWKPIAEKIPSNTIVYLSAEGVYNQINLEAIPIDPNKYVLDNSNIALVSSTKELINRVEISGSNVSKGNATLFGNPVFYKDLKESEYNTYTNRQISQLPGTLEEVNRLEGLLKNNSTVSATSYTNNQATEEKVKSLESPDIFHIATHGFFLEDESDITETGLQSEKAVTNPLLRSGLLLKNAGDLIAQENVYAFNKEEGILTAYEAMNLNLDNTKLVVLSACETGRGDNKVGEGVYGLQRAFLVAGAKSIIMSLFEVSDEATQKLMVYFYQNWINEKQTIRDAFIKAKKQLREEYNEPKYWGAFIMVGAA